MTPALPRILIYGDSLLLAGCEGTEVGIAGILVQLDPAITDLRVRESRTTRTDPNGRFVFADAQPGRYALAIRRPAGYWPTTPITMDIPALDAALTQSDRQYLLSKLGATGVTDPLRAGS
jgi:hypothetical protein